MMSSVQRVAIVDRRRLIREGIAALLADFTDIRVAGRAASVAELAREEFADVSVLVLGEVDRDASAATTPTVRLVSGMGIDDIVAQIRAAGTSTSGTVPSEAAAPPRIPPLTARELTVLRSVSNGLTAPEIASVLGISARTVELHKRSVMSKLGGQSQAEAVALAIEAGLLGRTDRD